MKKKKFRTILKYQGSRDGWMAADFHRLCDKKGPTVSLFKIKDNDQCVGGFTRAQWTSPKEDTKAKDNSAMLFNLTTCNKFKSQDNNLAIECWSKYGPAFGDAELFSN